jgi:hypothetical protein
MAAWILQINPIRLDVDGYVRSTNPIQGKVIPHFRNSVKEGDRVYLWRADGSRRGTGGVIALGRVVEEPRWSEPSPDWPIARFWRRGQPNPRWSASVHLDEIRLTEEDGMLLRTDLEQHPTLATLSVLTFRAASTFSLTGQQDEDLFDLWEQPGASP